MNGKGNENKSYENALKKNWYQKEIDDKSKQVSRVWLQWLNWKTWKLIPWKNPETLKVVKLPSAKKTFLNLGANEVPRIKVGSLRDKMGS